MVEHFNDHDNKYPKQCKMFAMLKLRTFQN